MHAWGQDECGALTKGLGVELFCAVLWLLLALLCTGKTGSPSRPDQEIGMSVQAQDRGIPMARQIPQLCCNREGRLSHDGIRHDTHRHSQAATEQRPAASRHAQRSPLFLYKLHPVCLHMLYTCLQGS